MKISDLPPGLKELALLRQMECIHGFDKDEDTLSKAFSWADTLEKYDFWDEIDDGFYTPFYNCKVVNCKLKTK